MFRKMMTILALVALVACSACNSVMGPTADVSSDRRTAQDRDDDVSPAKEDLSDGGGGGGGVGDDDQHPVDDTRRGHGNGDVAPIEDEQDLPR
jgi:hypothetical protein